MTDQVIATPGSTGRLLAELQKNPRKKLGQNFLVEETVVAAIAQNALTDPLLPVVEIGAGLGALSQALRPLTGDMLLVELDHGLAVHLQALFAGDGGVRILEADALQLDYDQLTAAQGWKTYQLFGNIPYHITSQLAEKLVYTQNWQTVTLLLQKEAAQRLLALPGKNNCPLALELAYVANGELLCTVPRNCFYPVPAVDSAVIKLTRWEQPPVDGDRDKLFALLHAAFSLRRKTLANALAASALPGDKAHWQSLLFACGFGENCRGEELSLQDYGLLLEYAEKKRGY